MLPGIAPGRPFYCEKVTKKTLKKMAKSHTCEEILQVQELIDREVWSPNFGTLLVSLR